MNIEQIKQKNTKSLVMIEIGMSFHNPKNLVMALNGEVGS